MSAVLQVVTAVLLVVSVALCSARFYVRVIRAKRHNLMEYAILAALVLQVILSGLQFILYDAIASLPEAGPEAIVKIEKLFFVGTFLYFGTLWMVKISINLLHIQLTRGLGRIHTLARYFVWVLVATLPIMYLVFLVRCLPVQMRWAGPMDPQCPPIAESYDFWIHNVIHISTDIALLILPFPALLKISERRLRVAVCGVYSLAVLSIVVTVSRLILIITDVEYSMERITVLSLAETTTCLVIATVPGISSTFIHKYVQTTLGGRNDPSSRARYRARVTPINRSNLKPDAESPTAIELPDRAFQSSASVYDGGDISSLAGSTKEIMSPVKP